MSAWGSSWGHALEIGRLRSPGLLTLGYSHAAVHRGLFQASGLKRRSQRNGRYMPTYLEGLVARSRFGPGTSMRVPKMDLGFRWYTGRVTECI